MGFKMKEFSGFTDEKYDIKESEIDGLGVIASKSIKQGELIGTAFDDEKLVVGDLHFDTRTILGRTLNHQDSENAISKSENSTLNIYAKNNIKQGEEITINYKKSPSYISDSANIDEEIKEYKEI